ncbi:hypothetical protein CEE44_00800 [Candidatus Woesearchaeota archaeon B3_Woes]|nr:MAG: hypothetical protein CEE44_00800 [Candidatus Woesearchaeota archaeon B3_Woes]
MKTSIRKGFGFGLTSGIITTLGLMVGLNSSTHSAIVVIGGIIVIAVADALSDALGIHISEEFEMKHSKKEIWESTISTFLSKLVFALTFIIPVLLFSLSTAVIISVIWGLFLITIFSIYIAKEQNLKPSRVVLEHLVITIVVILITNYLGKFVGSFT